VSIREFYLKATLYWVLIFFLLGILIFYPAHSLLFAAFDMEQSKKRKNIPTKILPQTRRTLQPRQSKPTPPKKADADAKAKTKTKPPPPKKAKANTMPTPPKKAKTNTTRANNVVTQMKKVGRHHDYDSFYDHFGSLCKYRDAHGTTKVP
jgi:hypothetical protein